jgi:hypothetical protein
MMLLSACLMQAPQAGPAAHASPPPAVVPTADAAPGIRFVDATAGSGLAATMTSGGTPSREILEVKGGGIALIDFDGDGDLDVLLPNGATLEDPEHGPGARLFENLGGLRFRDVTGRMGVPHTRWSYGCAVGDVDGDGRDDVFIACFGRNTLLRNLGDGRFEDITERAGVAGPGGWSTGAAFADLDGDGDLDLYVARYLDFDPAHPPPHANFKGIEVMAGPRGLPAQHDLLYENRGDGTFREVGEAAGIRAPAPAYGLNVAILDFDGDGANDILVGNDSGANFLFLNRSRPGALAFEEAGMRMGIATNLDGATQATMGIAIGDVNGDGRPDVLTTNFSSDTNTLHVNLDGRFFDDRTAQYGIGAPSRTLLGWAAILEDLDHDGEPDIVVFNGHVYPQATRQAMDSEYEQAPLVMRRTGSRFAVVGDPGPGLVGAHRDRSAVVADLDGDGDLDIIVAELNGPLRLLRNDSARPGDSVVLRLVNAPTGDRAGVGARVRLVDASGRARGTRWLWGGGPFQSTNAPLVHFGAPAEWGALAAEITWPGGATQVVAEVPRGRVVEVRRMPVASPTPSPPATPSAEPAPPPAGPR